MMTRKTKMGKDCHGHAMYGHDLYDDGSKWQVAEENEA